MLVVHKHNDNDKDVAQHGSHTLLIVALWHAALVYNIRLTLDSPCRVN